MTDGFRIERWSINEDGHLTVHVIGPLSARVNYCRAPRTMASAGSTPILLSAGRRDDTEWAWFYLADGKDKPSAQHPRRGDEAKMLDQLVRDHNWLRLLAEPMFAIRDLPPEEPGDEQQ